MAPQTPRESKVFCGAFFQKSDRLLPLIHAIITAFDEMEAELAYLTGYLDDETVRRLHARGEVAERLAEFRRRTAGRESAPTVALLEEARGVKPGVLTRPDESG